MRAILSLLALAAAGALPAQAPRLFKLSGKPGDKYAYSIKTSMSANGGKGSAGFEGRIAEKLLSVKPKELAWELAFKVTRTSESGVMQGAAAGFKQMDGLVMKRFNDPTGQTIKLMVGDMSIPGGSTPDLVFSPKPVKVGDSWSSSIDAQGTKVGIVYRLAGYGKYGKAPAARFTGTYKPGQMIKNITPLTFWVDLKTGKTRFAGGSFRATAQGNTVDVKFELKRL